MMELIRVAATTIDISLSESDYQYFLTLLPEEKRKRVLNFHFRADAFRSILGEILLRYQLKEYYGINEYQTAVTAKGKPFMVYPDNIKYNISHSGSWVICAISKMDIGIDVECVSGQQSLDDMEQISPYFMIGEELRAIKHFQKEERLERYFYFWTMREAFVKCTGEGIDMLKKNQYSLSGNYETVYRNERYIFKELPFQKNYKLAICMKGEVDVQEVEYVNIQKLLEMGRT